MTWAQQVLEREGGSSDAPPLVAAAADGSAIDIDGSKGDAGGRAGEVEDGDVTGEGEAVPLVPGKLQAWPGQPLPTQIFLPGTQHATKVHGSHKSYREKLGMNFCSKT